MKANELRIGNLVKIDRDIGMVEVISTIKHAIWAEDKDENIKVSVDGTYYDCTEDEIDPIPLTEDILRKCKSFRAGKNPDNQATFHVMKNKWEIKWIIEHWEKSEFNEDCFFIYGLGTFNYLHELQNWYFMKEKKELEVKL